MTNHPRSPRYEFWKAVWCELFHDHFRIVRPRTRQEHRFCWDCDRLDIKCPDYAKWSDSEKQEISELRAGR